MNELEIKEMKKEAFKLLKELEKIQDEKIKLYKRNHFKNKWWGITPESAIELYPNIK